MRFWLTTISFRKGLTDKDRREPGLPLWPKELLALRSVPPYADADTDTHQVAGPSSKI